ncbi:MAG: zinc dependent phospholipase C family protein [Thermodesulfobacteriota bacterium]
MIYFTIILTVIFVVLFPGDSFAWGPATHLDIGWKILNNTHGLAAGIKALIDTFPYDFLYGNISADIVVAKNLVREHNHCHNWKVGKLVLSSAKSDSQKAFAYGYLSHLAADTVAHNEFIPEMMVRSFSTIIHRHIYWELRFDALAKRSVWSLPDKIAGQVHEDNDMLLNSVITGTPLPFRANKRIFSSVLNLHKVDSWHKMIYRLSEGSLWALHKEDKDRWFALALDRVEGLLKDFDNAPCFSLDPIGRKNLKEALLVRKRLKKMKRRGVDYSDALEEALSVFRAV